MKNRIIKIFLSLTLIIGLISGMPISVQAAGKVVVAVSTSSLNVGDTVTVTATPFDDSGNRATATLTFTFDTSLFSFVSCSAGEGNYGGGPGGTVTASAAIESISITLKAVAAGSNTVTVIGEDGVTTNLEELGTLTSAGAKITVANASSNSGSDSSSNLSSDSSLSSLKISPGNISPSFKSSTVNYTANVEENITSIAVDAKPTNSKASVTSVTGNTNLAMGTNSVKITVKAENGTTSTYTIVVTRGAVAEETTTAAEEETQAVTANAGGKEMNIGSPDSDSIPGGFTASNYSYKGNDVPVAINEEKGLMLFYLTDEDTGESAFYLYDEENDSFYKYQEITVGSAVYILMEPDDTVTVPDGYNKTTVTIGDQQMDGWISDDDQEYCLLYAMNPLGEKNLYLYDFKENTILRVNDKLFDVLNGSVASDLKNQIEKLNGELSMKTLIALIIFAVLIIVCIILLILCIRLKRKNKKLYQDGYGDYYEEELAEEPYAYELELAAASEEEEGRSPEAGQEEQEGRAEGQDQDSDMKIMKDSLTEEQLKDFAKKCEEIISGQVGEFADVGDTPESTHGSGNGKMISLIDDDFEILDVDEEE